MQSPLLDESSESRSANRWSNGFSRVAVLLVAGCAIIFCAQAGLHLRRSIWEMTIPIRFTSDISRGFDWGRRAAREGYLNQYDKMQLQRPTDDDWLDYAPLRLAVMTFWARWANLHYPSVHSWTQNTSYEFTSPVLHFNTFMEIIGVVSAFFLTRLWVMRSTPAAKRTFFSGCLPGVVSALLLWFNPGILLSAYGWPTWDMWIVPMFLLAALLASLDFWFSAGIAIAIGAMFKGQQLTVAPIFVIWTIILWRPSATLRWIAGVLCGIGLLASPWILTFIPPAQLAVARAVQAHYAEPWQAPRGTFDIARTLDIPATIWVFSVLAASIALPVLLRKTAAKAPRPLIRIIIGVAAAALLIWPWFPARNRHSTGIGIVTILALMVISFFIPRRRIPFMAAGSVGLALLSCMSLFNGSTAWWDCGFHYGTIHWPFMVMGLTDNLPGIMAAHYGWPPDDVTTIALTIPAHFLSRWPADSVDLTIKQLLVAIYTITLILCGLGVGIHARRNDRRILIAFAAPWLMFFCFPPQIHERYLLFAAGVSCLCAGVSTGAALLGVLLSVITFIMTLHCMMDNNQNRLGQFSQILSDRFPSLFDLSSAEKLYRFCQGTHPDLGWAVLLGAAIFLYFSLATGKRTAA